MFWGKSICILFQIISKLLYFFYVVILHSHQENLAAFGGKSCSSQKQLWSDSYIQLYKCTQFSNINAKWIRFFSFIWLCLFKSLTGLMLEVNQEGITHIMLIWIMSKTNPYTIPFQNWNFSSCQYYPTYPPSNKFRVWKSFNQNVCKILQYRVLPYSSFSLYR